MPIRPKNAAFYFNFKREQRTNKEHDGLHAGGVAILGLKVMNILKAEGWRRCLPAMPCWPRRCAKVSKPPDCPFSRKERPSDALTAISAPEGVDGQAVYKNLRTQYGMTAAGGQDHLKGKIFRISHMGYIDSFDVITALAAVEMVIKGLGYPVKLGSGSPKPRDYYGKS